MHSLTERVLAHILREDLFHPGDRVGVAVSGGIDSVALLRLMLELRKELGIVISVLHFNHKLRGAESDADQQFVKALAREHELEIFCDSGDMEKLAAEEHSGIEAAARELRYGFFRRLLGAGEGPQGLKPKTYTGLDGAAKAAPLQILSPAEGSARQILSAAESEPFPVPTPAASDRSAESAAPPQSALLNMIATGHTLDDQAETVLMRMIRGTGMRGLGGIHPRLVVEHGDGGGYGEIVRPLLNIRRAELEKYLADFKQPWREDSSNSDAKFTRNRVRKLIVPLLEREFNPAIVESLSELAEIARNEEDYWENEISGWLGTVVQWSQPRSQGLVQIQPCDFGRKPGAEATPESGATGVVGTPGGVGGEGGGHGVLRFARGDEGLQNQEGPAALELSLSRPWLLTEPRAVQRRVLKAIGEQAEIPFEFKHIEEILRFATEDGPSGKELSLPLGWKVRREPEAMIFLTPDLRHQERIPDYEYSLPIPGRALVAEIGVVIEALRLAPGASRAEYNLQHLLRADLIGGTLRARNWRPGDRYWPAHTKSPKKIKELLQRLHIPQPGRRLWPVVTQGEEVVWMSGFPAPERLRAQSNHDAVLIREVPLETGEPAF